MTVLAPTAVLGLICAIIVITGAVSSNHGLQTPSSRDSQGRETPSEAPWWESIAKSLNQNKEKTEIPKLTCISSNPNIINLMQDSEDHCKGEDYKVTFYFVEDQEYIEIGSSVIDKYLFDNVLKKYSDWSLTSQKLRPSNRGNTSKVKKGSSDKNKPDNKNLNKVLESLERDLGEDNLTGNIVKEQQPTVCDSYSHKNVDNTNVNTQNNEYQDIFEDNENYNRNDKKFKNIKSKFNPKHKYFEVLLPEDIHTSLSPTTINVHIDETNKNIAKNGKNNIEYNKGSYSDSQEKEIPSEYQNIILGDINISDIVDVLLNNGGYVVNLKAPLVFNLDKSQDLDTIQSNLEISDKDTALYQKDLEGYFNNIVDDDLAFSIDSSNNVCPSNLRNKDINQEEQPFYIDTVASDYKYSDTDSNDYIIKTSEGTKCYNDFPKRDDSKSITIDDLNSYSYTQQASKTLKNIETEFKSPVMSPKHADFIIDAYSEFKPSESMISIQAPPPNKNPKPLTSFNVEVEDSQSPDSFVVNVNPSTTTKTLPVNTNEPTNNDNTLTYLPESKPTTIPLTLHELMPLRTTSPSLSHTNHISDSPLPADTSYISLLPLNYKNQIAKDKLKGHLPTFAKNKLWNPKYVQPIEVPLTSVSSPSIINLPTTTPSSYTSVPITSPSLIAPKTAYFVTQSSMAADSNLNTNKDTSKPASISQIPLTGSTPSVSKPIELSEKCLQQFLRVPELVTLYLSSPEHTNSPSEILLSKIPQVTEASTSIEAIPLIHDDMNQLTKWNNHTIIQHATPSIDSLATTAKKDYTKDLHSQELMIGNYKLLQQFPNNKQIPALKNVMTSPKTTKAYFTPKINPYISTIIPTREEFIEPIMTTRIRKPTEGSIVSNNIQPIIPLDKPTYFTATSIAPKSESTPKEVCPLPSISGTPINSFTNPFTFSSTPMSASPVKPLKGIFQSAPVSDKANIISTSPSNFIEPMQSYATPLIKKFKTLPCTSLPKLKEFLKPIYEVSSDPLLDTINPDTVPFISPLYTEQMLKAMPITSSLESSDQNYIQFAKPSSLFNKYNSYTAPSKGNVQYLSTYKPLAVPVPLPLTVKPIEIISESTSLTDKTAPAWSSLETIPLPEIPILPSEVCATPIIDKVINNLKPVPINHITTAPSILLWSENNIPIGTLSTMSPQSNDILQSNLLKTISASPFVMSNDKELIQKTTPVYTSPMLNAKIQNKSPLICSDSLLTKKKLPTYKFQPKPPDDIPMSPVADYVTPILSPLNSISLPPIKVPYTKPPVSAILTTPLPGEVTPTSSYTSQPHPTPSDVSPLYSKETPIHTTSSNFVTPLSYTNSSIYEDIPQTLPLKNPKKEIFSSESPLDFAKSSVASSTPLSPVSQYSPPLAKVVPEASYATPISIEKTQSIPVIRPMVPSAVYTSPLRGTTMKNNPLLVEEVIPLIAPYVTPLSTEKIQSMPALTPAVPSAAYTSPFVGTITRNSTLLPSISLQNQKMVYPMVSQYIPLTVSLAPTVNRPLQGEVSQWKPLEHYTLPLLSVDYTPVLEKEPIQSIPLNRLKSTVSNPQYLSTQQVPLHPYKYETLSSPQYSVPSLPKSDQHSFWSKPHSSKDIPILHTDYSQSVLCPLSSPDFSMKSKLYPLTYTKPLSVSTPLNSDNLKFSPLNLISSDIKAPTYSTFIPSPINNQIIPYTQSTPVVNALPIETITQTLQPLDIDKVNYATLVKSKSIPETVTSLPPTITSNDIYKKVAQITSPLQPAVTSLPPSITSNPFYQKVPQITSPLQPTVAPLPSSVTSNPFYQKVPRIISPLQPAEPQSTPIKAFFSNNLQPQLPPKDVTNRNKYISEIMTPKATLSDPKLKDVTPVLSQTIPYTEPNIITAGKWSSKTNTPTISNNITPCTHIPLAYPYSNIPEPIIKTSLTGDPLSEIQFTKPLKYPHTLKPSSLPTTRISYTSIQPLFIPVPNQIPSNKLLDLSPSDYAVLDIAKDIAPIAPTSLSINSKSNPLQYADGISGSLMPISPLSESKNVQYTPASSTPINPFGKSSSLIDSAPVLVSPLQPPTLDTNFVAPPLSLINSLLNLKFQHPLSPLANTPLIPARVLPPYTDGHFVKPILLPLDISSPAYLEIIQPTVPSPIAKPLQLICSPCNALLPKTSTFVPRVSTVKPLLPTITSPSSIQPLFTPKLSVPSAASVTNATNSLKELHNIQSGTILSPIRLTTPIITPFDSTTQSGNLKSTSTSPLYSVLPETIQSYQATSPVPTSTNIQFYDPVPLPGIEPKRYSTPSVFPVRPLPLKYTPKLSPLRSFAPCSFIKNAPFSLINPSSLLKPINIPFPRPLPLKYTKLAPKQSPYWSFAPCSSNKNVPFSVISPSPLSKPIKPCSIHSKTGFTPIMTPQSSPTFPIDSTFTSAPISYTPQPFSSMSKSFLPSNTVSPTVISVQHPYISAEYITPEVSPLPTKLNTFPSNFDPLMPVSLPVNPLFANPKLTNAENTTPLSISPPINSVSILPLLQYKALSTSPNYVPNSSSILKPLMSSPLSENRQESPIIVSPIQTSFKQYSSTPLFTPSSLKPVLTTPYVPGPLSTNIDSKTVSPITKYSNSALDTSKLPSVIPTYITPLSNPNSKTTSNLELTPLELNQYIATKSAAFNTFTSKQNFFAPPLQTMKPCHASQRLSYLSPTQTPLFTPNYKSNVVTNTLPISKKPLSCNPYSNTILSSVKDFSPIAIASPLTPTQYKSIQPLILPTTNSIGNPVVKSTTVPIKSFPALPFTKLPTSNIPCTISSPTSFVTPLLTPMSSTLDPSSSQKPITSFPAIPFTKLYQSNIPCTISSPTPYITPLFTPMSSTTNPSPTQKPITSIYKTLTTRVNVSPQYVSSLLSVASQESIQPLITNIGTPASLLTQPFTSKTTPCSTYISSKDHLVTPAEIIQPLQPISLSKASLSPYNVQKPITYEQSFPHKLISKIDNLAEYYHNPSYSISSFSNDNICKPLDSINDEKSPSFKTVSYSNVYSKPLTTVPTWKEMPLNPIPQSPPIYNKCIDDSMFKIYPLPLNTISGAPNIKTLQYEPYNNNLKPYIPVANKHIAPIELQNNINNIESIKFDRQKAEITIPLGKLVLPNKEHTNQITHDITPSIGLRMWPSNITLVEAKLQLKFKYITVNNFQPVVNELDSYDVIELQKIVKNYIRNKYGDVIVVPNNYYLNSQYNVIKDCSSTCDNRCNLLWPADTPSQSRINYKSIL